MYGRLGWPGRLVCCLVPLLTFGTAGLVPSLVLAIRRRRAVDVVWALVFGLLQLWVYVAFGLLPDNSKGTPTVLAGMSICILMFLTPVHYLVMDVAKRWPQPTPRPTPRPVLLYPQYTAPYVPPAATPPADDLQQLGELLRRQVRDGGGQR